MSYSTCYLQFNMFIMTCILLSAVLQKSAFTYGSVRLKTGGRDKSNTETGFYEMAKVILELQTTYCDYMPLCMVNVSAYSKHKLINDKCCISCSCESDCKQSHSCCPDFWIRDVIPDVIFEDADHLMDTLRNKSDWKKRSESEIAFAKDALETAEECVSSRLLTNRASQKIIEIHEDYIMISKCPNDYGKDKNELHVKEQCEHRTVIGDFLVDLDLDLSANTLIPWSSLKSGVTYRNAYCLQCNEGTHGGTPWSSWFTCGGADPSDSVSYIQNVLYEPVFIFRSMTRLSYCNIIFEPPRITKGLKLKKCNYADVKTCSKDWISATNDTVKVALYENTCNNFYSPIIASSVRDQNIYNNIVCKMCNTLEWGDITCSRFVKGNPRVELNTNTITRFAKTGTSSGPLPLNILTNDNSPCAKGYIFDNIDNTCRMIYCPGNFFNDNGTCVPKILHTDGFYYSTKLVVATENHTSLVKTEVKIFESNLYEFLDRILMDNFENFSIKIWRQTENGTLKPHLIYITFRNDYDTYADSLWLLRKMLQNISTFEVQTDDRIIPLTVRVLKYDVFSISTLARDSFVVNDIFDKSQKRRLKLVYDKAMANFTSRSQLQISRTHLCFRTIIGQSDVQVYGRGIAKIRRTNITLQGTDFDINFDGMLVYVCIEDFLNVDVNVRAWWGLVFPPTPVDNREPEDEVSQLLPVIVSVLCGSGLVLCMAIVYKCIKRNMLSDTDRR